MDDKHSGRAILWTPATGLEQFENIAVAQKQLQQRTDDNNQSHTLLENLPRAQRRLDQQYTPGSFQLIEDRVSSNRMQSGIEQFWPIQKSCAFVSGPGHVADLP